MKTALTPKRVIHKKRYRHILQSLDANGLTHLKRISDELRQTDRKSISPNNLWNHMNRLVKLGLLVKIEKDAYCLSSKGNTLISAYNLEKESEELYENL